MDEQQTATNSLTIPAREVRPGDVLFGMTVDTSTASSEFEPLWFLSAGVGLWIEPNREVTVERPVPSDPIGTVRATFVGDRCVDSHTKIADNTWRGGGTDLSDSTVAGRPILWKPGMPIPSEGAE